MTPSAAQDRRQSAQSTCGSVTERERSRDALMEPTDAIGLEELTQLLSTIDEDEDCEARRLRDLLWDHETAIAAAPFDFLALEGREDLRELESPLLNQQELLNAGSLDDFLQFTRAIESRRPMWCFKRMEDPVSNRSGSIKRSRNDQHELRFAVQSSVDSQWNCNLEIDLQPFTKIKQEPEEREWLEAMISDAAHVDFPEMDARVFTPKFSVRIKDEAMPMELAYQGIRHYHPSFLVGPRSIANLTAQGTKETKKNRSRARISASRLSEIRRAGAAGRSRKSGRFLSKTQFVSVTALQEDQKFKPDSTDDKRSVFPVYMLQHEMKAEQDHKLDFKTELMTESGSYFEKNWEIELQKQEMGDWPSAASMDDLHAPSDIKELTKAPVKIDCDTFCKSTSVKSVKSINDSAVDGQGCEHFLFGLDSKAVLDRPLLFKQEPESILDFMHGVSATKNRVDAYSKQVKCEILPQKTEDTKSEKLESAVQVISESDWSDSERVKQELMKPEAPIAPERTLWPQLDARIFVPKSQVRIEGRAHPSDARTGFICQSSALLAGPPVPLVSTNDAMYAFSRERSVQRWKSKRKHRTTAKPSDSYISQVRRAGAAIRKRINGRFASNGTPLISVTALQQ